tara:strand:- start:2329 stop:2541 length:213 start_codon:yes stop_codon:yes gene_type:complete
MVNDSKDIKNLGPQVKATFAGEVLEESSSPKSIFACRAASVKAVEDALSESVCSFSQSIVTKFWNQRAEW